MMRPPGGGVKRRYRFCYRIRVENIVDLIDMKKGGKNSGTRDVDDIVDGEHPSSEDPPAVARVEHRAVQLLGRTWNISERPSHEAPSSVLQRLLEEGVMKKQENGSSRGKHDGSTELKVVQTVNEPRTGAVGHLPVLGPGEVFEYMSGADIATPSGTMEGCFHMASVDMQSTDSAHVGDHVEALHWNLNDDRKFEMPIGRFGLVLDEEDLNT